MSHQFFPQKQVFECAWNRCDVSRGFPPFVRNLRRCNHRGKRFHDQTRRLHVFLFEQLLWDELSYHCLGPGFKYLFIFTPTLGEMIQFDSYFSKGLVQPPTSCSLPRFFVCQQIFLHPKREKTTIKKTECTKKLCNLDKHHLHSIIYYPLRIL